MPLFLVWNIFFESRIISIRSEALLKNNPQLSYLTSRLRRNEYLSTRSLGCFWPLLGEVQLIKIHVPISGFRDTIGYK